MTVPPDPPAAAGRGAVRGAHPAAHPTAPVEPRTWRHYGAYAGMCAIWGSTFLVIRVGNEAVAPLWAATLRLAIAAVLLAGLTLATRAPFPRGPALTAALLYGVLNFGINFVLLYWGELHVPSGLAAIFYATIPLSTGVFAWLMRVHPLEPAKMVAAVIGLAGVVIIFAGEVATGAPPLALAGVFVAATCASLSGVFLKRAPQPAIPANAVGAAVGMVICLGASAIAGEPHALPRTSAGWGPILYLAILGNLGAFVLWSWLVTQWTITTVSTGALVIPVIAVLLGALAKGEALAPGTYLGAILVLGSVGETLWIGRMAPEGQDGPPRYARILAPPPLILLAALGIGLWLTRLAPRPWLPSGATAPLAIAAAAAGGGVGLAALAAFRRARTTFLPYRESTAIVTDGPFRFTRNPLYLSLVLWYLAGALWWNSLWMALLLPVLVAAMSVLVIRAEEQYLEARFGEAYRAYRTRVRRWL